MRDRQFHQRQRISRRLPQETLAHARRQPGGAGVKQRGRRRRGQRAQRHRWQPGLAQRGLIAVADGRDQQDRLELEPPGDERQRIAGGLVEPVGVVRDNEDRGSRRGLRHQVERGERGQERVGDHRIGHAERRQHRVPLRRPQRVHPAEQGLQQAVQPGERKHRLRLHPGDLEDQHSALARTTDGLAKQRRLADAGPAAHHQRAALIGDPVKQPAQQPDFGFAPEQ